jgi:hypothetical protein
MRVACHPSVVNSLADLRGVARGGRRRIHYGIANHRLAGRGILPCQPSTNLFVTACQLAAWLTFHRPTRPLWAMEQPALRHSQSPIDSWKAMIVRVGSTLL